MRKMKVLHVLNSNKYSGAENVVITIISAMKNEVDGYYVSPDGPIRDMLEEKHIPYVMLPDRHVNQNNIKEVIRSLNPDVIHAHDFTAGVAVAMTGTRIPIVNHLHNNVPWLKKFGMRSLIYGLSCARYKKILTVSDSIMKEFVFGIAAGKKAQIVGNPINLENIVEKAAESCSDGPFDIAYLGRLSKQKNPMLFLEIIHEIKKENGNLKVAVIGDGEMRKEVKERIHQLDLEKEITLYGFQKNPYKILKNAKVLCMPSAWEGFGLAAVEALALGRPVVASPVGGLKKIVNNSCGKLCTNKEEFVAEIESLLFNKDKYLRKSEGALRRAKEYGDIKEYMTSIIDVYKSITNKENSYEGY